MNKSQYNPEIHHRKSIRLKGHDYAGGGLYFVTICAHRNAGNIFAPKDVKEMIADVWESVGAGLVSARGGHKTRPYVIMPDHFHALIQIPKSIIQAKSLGDIICEFKSRAVHEYIANVKLGKWPRFEKKIWHRNYYEIIVRDAEAEKKISDYIMMNPWKCITNFGSGLRGMGNPTLWQHPKTGILCSRNGAPAKEALAKSVPDADVYLGGFHSPPEQAILQELLRRKARIIYCPAWGLKGTITPILLDALADNRMLLLEMENIDGNLAAARERNKFILQNSDELWLPHITPGGMLDKQITESKK